MNINKALFSLTPLGGVDEIGSNMTVFETQNQVIIIDYGILFPHEDFFDINYLVPDLSSISREKNISLIFSHGHEDHIGGVAQFIKEFPMAHIYATNFTKILIEKKLNEFNLKAKISTFNDKTFLNFDNLIFNFVRVNHSIPETHGILVKDSLNNYSLVFISDFKIDNNNSYESSLDFTQIINFQKYTKNKVALLDSTNILIKGKTTAESELLRDLESFIKIKDKRIFITLFASNLHRILAIYSLAKKHHKPIVVAGRSIAFYIDAGIQSGILPSDFSYDLVDSIQDHNSYNKIYLVSGCQGDFFSYLRRFAFNEDKYLKPTENDIILFSSKSIPGNEKKISRIINSFTKFKAKVITAKDFLIHASGHPGQEDIKEFLNCVELDHYIPIHGETYFLDKHRSFIKDLNPHIKTYDVHNFDTLYFFDNKIEIKPLEIKPPIIIHGGAYLPIEKEKINERRKLASEGLIVLSINVTSKEAFLTSKGLPTFVNEYENHFKKEVLNFFTNNLKSKISEKNKEEVRIFTRKYYSMKIGYKPQVIIHLC